MSENKKTCPVLGSSKATSCQQNLWWTEGKGTITASACLPSLILALASRKQPFYLHHSFNSLATLEAIFLKLIDVPAMRLKRTPFRDNRGSLHTSISHCTWLASAWLPWKQNNKKFSRCSYSQLLLSKTFLISSIISCGSIALVVFMLHVKRRERGLSPIVVSFIDLKYKIKVGFQLYIERDGLHKLLGSSATNIVQSCLLLACRQILHLGESQETTPAE